MIAISTPLSVFRTWNSLPAGVNRRRIFKDCQYFQLTPDGPPPSISPLHQYRSPEEGQMGRVVRRAAISCACFALFLLATPAAAQERASIVGVVQDTSNAVMPGVTVEASSPALIE